MRKTTILNVTLLIFLSYGTSHAQSWMDDWLNQKVVTSPGYFEGQKRGYYTAGGFSGRWYSGTEYLATLQPPRVKAGCGGIDVYGGGIAFLDQQYIVDEFQNILPAAAAVMFDMALNEWCVQCAKAMKTMKSISNQLNQLQLNDCQISKVVVAKMMDMEDHPKLRGEVESFNSMVNGVTDSWDEIKQIWGSDGQPQRGDTQGGQSLSQGCPNIIKSAFLTPETSILESIGTGYSSDFIAFARGLVGDVYLTQTINADGTDQLKPILIKPCPDNNDSVDSIVTGKAQSRAAGLGGTCNTVTGTDLVQWALTRLDGIASKIKSKTALSSDEEAFINTLPLPIYRIIQTGISTGQEEQILNNLAQFVARAYAFRMLADMENMVRNLIASAEERMSAEVNPGSATCSVEHITKPIMQGLKNISERLWRHTQLVHHDYRDWLEETIAINAVAERSKRFEVEMEKNMSMAFGDQIARRFMRR